MYGCIYIYRFQLTALSSLSSTVLGTVHTRTELYCECEQTGRSGGWAKKIEPQRGVGWVLVINQHPHGSPPPSLSLSAEGGR